MNSPGGMNVGGVYYDVELNTGQLLQDSRKADSALRGVEFRMGAVALGVRQERHLGPLARDIARAHDPHDRDLRHEADADSAARREICAEGSRE